MEPTDWALDGNVCLGLEMYSQVWMSICMCGGRCLCIVQVHIFSLTWFHVHVFVFPTTQSDLNVPRAEMRR